MATTKKYTVADGDTLDSIALKNGTTASELASLNGLGDTSTLYTGSEINLPDTLTPAATPATAPSPYSTGHWYSGTNAQAGASAGSVLQGIEGSAPTYEQSDAVKLAQQQLAERENSKPGEYQSAYADRIDQMLNNILSREDFTYDPSDDALYQMYREQYQKEGERTMMDTVAEASSLTGGYGNSYAATAGSQQYQSYLSQLNGILPELYGQARDEYNAEGDRMYQDLSMLQGLDESDYGRYQDDLDAYYSDLSYYYTKYSDMSEQEYNAYLADLSLWQSDRDYWYGKYADEQALAAAAAARSSGSGGRYSSGSGGGASGSSKYMAFTSMLDKVESGSAAVSKSSLLSQINSSYYAGTISASEKSALQQRIYNIQDRNLTYYSTSGVKKSVY